MVRARDDVLAIKLTINAVAVAERITGTSLALNILDMIYKRVLCCVLEYMLPFKMFKTFHRKIHAFRKMIIMKYLKLCFQILKDKELKCKCWKL